MATGTWPRSSGSTSPTPPTERPTSPGSRERLGELDSARGPAGRLPPSVRPPEVISAASASSVPLAVGASFAAVGAVGVRCRDVGGRCGGSSSARRAAGDRLDRRPGQVVRALPSRSPFVVVALVVGVPLGILAGRLAWDDVRPAARRRPRCQQRAGRSSPSSERRRPAGRRGGRRGPGPPSHDQPTRIRPTARRVTAPVRAGLVSAEPMTPDGERGA